MKTRLFLAGFAACLMLWGCGDPSPRGTVSVVPLPRQAVLQKGRFTFSAGTHLEVENEDQAAVARLFAGQFAAPAGFTPAVTIRRDTAGSNETATGTANTGKPDKATAGTIRLETDTALAPENYRLDVQPGHILIRAADLHGFFYALQSLRQQLPCAIESPGAAPEGTGWQIPAQTLSDGPRFPYRGLMLDVARYFMPTETIRKMIDGMALLKLNYLHLHLVDDNGWRLEIKRYPRLTEVGAWRVARDADFAQRKNPRRGEPATVGGFYTQEEMRALVAYAAERQITIIPEIEMPAHSNSALAAYPSLACPVVKDFIGVLPGLGGHAAEIIYCAGNDEVFHFLEGVIDEVCSLFPSPYIHLGGDEAAKTHWRRCPRCQARMKAEGLTDVEDLQGYFMQRMCAYVQSKGRQVMGWDELTNSRIPDGAIIFGWQGLGQAGYKAGQAGHPFIMTPAQVSYLIRYQGPQWFEPRTYFGNNTLQTVYDYEPVQPDWEAAAAARLMGVQASLWTEFVNTPADVDYLVFPRLAALAEVAWCPKGSKDWPGFLGRLDSLDTHLEAMGIGYARSMYNLDHRVDIRPKTGDSRPDGADTSGGTDTLEVTLSSIRPDLEIRYTTDGSAPSAASPLFTGPLRLTAADFSESTSYAADRTEAAGPAKDEQTGSAADAQAEGTTEAQTRSTADAQARGTTEKRTDGEVTRRYLIRAATFARGRQMGEVLTLPLEWHKATARPVSEIPLAASPFLYRLVNGLRGSDKYTDFEWCGWQGKDAAVVIDLGKMQPVGQIVVGCITNYGMGVHLPRRIALAVSDDGQHFRKIAEKQFTDAEIFREGIRREDQTFRPIDARGRYLRIEVANPGPCPPDHTRPGQPSWVYLDEIIVR